MKLHSLGACLLAALMASALLPGEARAQAAAIQIPFGLGPSKPWRENIGLGIDLWLVAHENARRAMLLQRCTALDRTFPDRPAPAMVAASDEVLRWMAGEAHADLPPEPVSAATRGTLPVLANHAFSAGELQDWEALRNSPQGRRGLAAHEVDAALLKATDSLVDVSSGHYWSWPLARLARLADAQGMRAELDAAFDKVLGAGSAARLRDISLVPGDSRADTPWLERVDKSGEALADAFLAELAPADLDAYERIAESPVLRRWMAISQALPAFGMGPEVAVLQGRPQVPATVAEFCSKQGLLSCEAGGELHTALTRYRSEFADAVRSDTLMNSARKIVRALPASGCS